MNWYSSYFSVDRRVRTAAAVLIALLLVALPLAAAFAADSGFLAPANYTNGGPDLGWTDPQEGLTSNNVRVKVSISGRTVQYHDFTFPALPAGTVMDGIEVSIEGMNGGRQALVDLSWDGGTTWTTGDGTGVKTTALTDVETDTFLGGPSDTWGSAHTWVPADFSGSPNTTFRMRLTSLVGGGGISIDQVMVKIYYHVPTFTLTYTAGAHGSISGTSPQTVDYGGSGSAVTAVADPGYYFVNWSDASTDNPRTDTNITADLSVTANFAPLSGFSSWVGSLTVTSDRSVVAVGRPHIGAEVASYDGVSGGSLTAYAPMLFKDSFGGSYDSALYIQNVNAAHTASITIKFYDSAGALSCTKDDTVAPLSSKGYWIPSELCLPAGWVGGAVITSNYNIVAVGRPHVGAEVMTYNGFSEGTLTSYLPMLFKKAWGSYDSAFYVQNVEAVGAAHLTIKFYDTAGALSCMLTDTISPLASKGWWLPSETCLPAGWVGSAVVTSDRNIVTIGRIHVGTQVTSYSGFNGGGAGMYVPMLFKNAFGGSYNAALYVQNLDTTSTANVTIKFYSEAGTLDCTLDDTIAPLASKGWWVPAQSCLPIGWVGGAVVTSDTNIVAVGRPHVGAQITSYSGIASGGSTLYLPMLFRNAFGGSYNSAFYIQNTNAANAAHVTLKFFDTDGNLACQRTDTIPALATLGFWVPDVTCQP